MKEWVEATPYEELPEVQEHLANHERKRAEGEIEIRHTGWLRWEWRFYWGRYVVSGYLLHWADHETGVAWSKTRALRIAQKRQARLHRSHQPWRAA